MIGWTSGVLSALLGAQLAPTLEEPSKPDPVSPDGTDTTGPTAVDPGDPPPRPRP